MRTPLVVGRALKNNANCPRHKASVFEHLLPALPDGLRYYSTILHHTKTLMELCYAELDGPRRILQDNFGL